MKKASEMRELTLKNQFSVNDIEARIAQSAEMGCKETLIGPSCEVSPELINELLLSGYIIKYVTDNMGLQALVISW